MIWSGSVTCSGSMTCALAYSISGLLLFAFPHIFMASVVYFGGKLLNLRRQSKANSEV